MLAKYMPRHEGDKTVLLLQTFLDELPQQGSDNLREDIHGCNSDQQLRDLANHLIFHILTPCMFLITSLKFVEVLASSDLASLYSESKVAHPFTGTFPPSWLGRKCRVRGIRDHFECERAKVAAESMSRT